MSDSVNELYEQGLQRYQAGESPEDLIPLFKEICDRAPKLSAAWTSLAWLYLICDKPKSALKAAQKSVKLDHNDAQGRVNLSLAMLEADQKGVRQHIEVAQQLMSLDPEIRNSLEESIADGFKRKPDWDSLQRVQNWLFL